MPVLKVCGHCERSFSVPFRRHETVKFCSVECKNNAKRVTLVCAGCGGSFERRRYEAAAKYCSDACFHSAMVGATYDVGGRQRYHRACEVCGVEFRVTMTRKDTARFCSRACQSSSPTFRAEMSATQTGEKHWRWAGGLYRRGTGYVRERGQNIGSATFRFEHRLVIERALLAAEPNHPFLIDTDGVKRLDPTIEVHHLDHDRSNNAFSNLLAVTKHAHAQIHHRNRKPDPWECWPNDHAMKYAQEKVQC
jgi:transcription elongation factor Elf1